MNKSFIFLALVALLTSCSSPRTGQNSFSRGEIQRRAKELNERAVSTNVHSSLRPVRLIRDGKPYAFGTLVLDSMTNVIVTADHVFPKTRKGSSYYYDFQIFPDGKRGHISQISLDSCQGGRDIAFGYIGKPRLLSRLAEAQISAKVSRIQAVFIPFTPVEVTSLITGKSYKVIGKMKNDGFTLYVMLYSCLPGESGSGFWGDDGRLYVLSGSFSSGAREFKGSRVSLMSAVEIESQQLLSSSLGR